MEVVLTGWPDDAVGRGAEMLDKADPQWRDGIQTGWLVAPQVQRLYELAMTGRGLRPYVGGHAVTFGFDVPHVRAGGNEAWRLEAAWREAVLGGAA